MRISENVLISSLTTMRLGGPARYVIEIESRDDIPFAFNFAHDKNLPFFILGGGANTIGHDAGFPGVIIKNGITGIDSKILSPAGSTIVGGGPNQPDSGENDGDKPRWELKIQGGEIWDNVVKYACKKSLTGIEALSKIPGLTGAAPVQNIGAYGQEIADTLISIDVFDTKDSTFKTLPKSKLGFSYRKSILNTTEKGRYFVISITLGLKVGQMSRPFYNSIERYIFEQNITDFSPASIRNIVNQIRADKLPDPLLKPSAGSFFKNIYLSDKEAKIAEVKGYPVYHGQDGCKINSGWLIEQCGLKGQLIHGFRVNNKAALVLINESATSYADLEKARAAIIQAVYDKFGYQLEQEPVEIK